MTDQPCPCCLGSMHARKDWLHQCRSCGFLRSTLVAGSGAPIAGVENVRQQNFELILDEVGRHCSLHGARILEVGCSTGTFLLAARSRGAEISAIEPELRAAERARKLGFQVEHGYFPADLHAPGPFDLVVFNDVFEHLPHPADSLQAACDRLASGGLLILNLPSSDGVLYRLANVLDRCGISAPLERLWQRGLSSPHLTYFNPRNLGHFVTRHSDLNIVRQRSLKTLTREGLRERVSSTVTGPVGWFVFGGLFMGAGVVQRMPPDIQFMLAARR